MFRQFVSRPFVRRNMLLAVLGLFALSACATSTPYGPAKDERSYGFSEQKIEESRYRITFRGNSLTSRETVENFLLYRAAELTEQNGFDYFIVVEGDTETKTSYSTSNYYGGPAFFGRYGYGYPGRYYAFPYYAYGFGWGHPYSGGVTREITRYSAIAFVTMHKGEKPQDNPQAFDAGDVLKNLQAVVTASQPEPAS